jgi:alpha-N-arabinofuranosidase
MNNADRVKIACLAQLVNVLGAIRTETGGKAWRQTIFHPFAQASKFGHGNVLRAKIATATFATGTHQAAPLLVASVVHDPETGAVAIFALNRSGEEEMALDVELRGLGRLSPGEALELHHADIKAINSRDAEHEVSPVAHPGVRNRDNGLLATLKPRSWNVFVLHAGR